MGNVAGYRTAWIAAANYARKWDRYNESYAEYERKARDGSKDAKEPDPPERNLELDTLAGVLDGAIIVQNHCYRGRRDGDHDRHLPGVRLQDRHVPPRLGELQDRAPAGAERASARPPGPAGGASKLEAFDGIEENAPILHKAGACAVIHSDDANIIQRLNQEAAAALSAG
jgi:hypothetical protein